MIESRTFVMKSNETDIHNVGYNLPRKVQNYLPCSLWDADYDPSGTLLEKMGQFLR